MGTKKVATKETTKATEVKEVKVEAPVVEVKAEVKEEIKKAPAKKAAAKAETVITLEFGDYTAVMSTVEEKVKAQIVAEGVKASAIKSLNIYVKPFENKAYYVIPKIPFVAAKLKVIFTVRFADDLGRLVGKLK